ncbi:hypothetical protein U1E44_15550 [Arenibacter sp. GZD96]|uniref:hypothetical protein n=1 Tax=Aurantibrevibacter litoralis TaxID=3106030 RepID=UPI002AFFA22D|nr:hypothetical protein [Arenibacter sp. GZD-96]MEA1787517.1 hypothetical protein [Arenibacter sp. GZD-96]
MAFNYGKQTLDIKNPFKTEGLLDVVFGTLVVLLGIILVFRVRISIASGAQLLAWLELIVSVVFLAVGIRAIIVGSVRLFRFLVGRDVPANISPFPYNQETIEKVLMRRTNPTFIEKNDFVSRLLISVFHKSLFLPIGFRNLMESVASLLLSFLLFFAVYSLTIFSTSIGLIHLTDKTAIISLFGLFFVLKQFVVWFTYRPNTKRISLIAPSVYSYKNIIINILLAILAPVFLEVLARNGAAIPSLEINFAAPIALLFVCSLSLVLISYFLSLKRLEVLHPETAVSEYKEHIQVSVHPKDIFRCFEIEMANKRYMELPNRVYKEIKPILELEGSQNKGSFHGSTIQETQPIPRETNLPDSAKKERFYVALTGRVFLLFGFILLFLSLGSLPNEITVSALFTTFYYPALIVFFAYYLIRIAHLFYSEILFSSFLVHFFSDGTYTDSKVSSGMSVYDSNRSENTVVNTSATPWILVSEIVTSTFADSSTKNLEGNRFIIEMYKADDFLGDLVNGFTSYLGDRQLIVGFNTKTDIENSLNFHKLNEMTRSKNPLKDRIEEHTRREDLEE